MSRVWFEEKKPVDYDDIGLKIGSKNREQSRKSLLKEYWSKL